MGIKVVARKPKARAKQERGLFRGLLVAATGAVLVYWGPASMKAAGLGRCVRGLDIIRATIRDKDKRT